MTLETKASIFSDNAFTILCKRYFAQADTWPVCERCGKKHETENAFLDRVSMGNETYRKELIEPLYFLPNSPTLFNIGLPGNRTLSACFKFDVEDNMFDTPDGIMPVAMKATKVLKAGGGVGFALNVRPEGALVNSTHGSALGPLGVMRIYHQLAREITQGGKRDAAQMAILHCEHPDVEKFIHAKDEDPDHLGTFNISVALTDEFMRTATKYNYALDGAPPGSYREYFLLKAMAESAWKTGDPGCYFIDAAERANPTPWAGKLTGTNPCGEVPLLNNEPCNLGSINLGKMLTAQGEVNWALLLRTVELAIQYLDDVLDRNVFPDPEIDAAARYTRKLGLGVCGFQDMLVIKGIPYDSDEAVNLGTAIMSAINKAAENESLRLGEVKGVAPCFAGRAQEDFAKGIKYPRNATRTCIAPTGTIAIFMDASSGIEPYFALVNTRTMGDGTTFIEQPWPLRAIYNFVDFAPKIADEISYEWHIKHQAAFQAHTDLAVSKTINMPKNATPEDIYEAYVMMWQMGCKGGTIYRDGSRDNQVLKHIDSDARVYLGFESAAVVLVEEAPVNGNGWRDALPRERPSITHKFEVGGMEGYAHVSTYPDGSPSELFLDVARQGSTLDGMVDWLAQGVSVAFQMAHKHGVPFTVFTNKWIGRKFEPSGLTTNPAIPMADSLADYLGRWLNMRFAGTTPPVQELSLSESRGEMCPDCGGMLIHSEGCAHCNSCGYEKC